MGLRLVCSPRPRHRDLAYPSTAEPTLQRPSSSIRIALNSGLATLSAGLFQPQVGRLPGRQPRASTEPMRALSESTRGPYAA